MCSRNVLFSFATVTAGALWLAGCGAAASTSPTSQPSNEPASEVPQSSPVTEAGVAGPAMGQGGQHGHAHGHQHRFDVPAAYAARWESPERDAWQQPTVLVAAMGIEPEMAVADIGTGTGYRLRSLSEATGPDGSVFAIDVEPAMHFRMAPQVVIDVLAAAGFAAELAEYGNERQYAVLATRPVVAE